MTPRRSSPARPARSTASTRSARPATPPAHETRRLQALQRYDILDTPPERDFDELTALAAEICRTPISLVSLVDDSRQWFKSRVGLALPETPRTNAFCDHAIRSNDLMIVADAHLDDRFADNPLVRGAPGIRFYAGAPLVTADGAALGTLCVIDHVPRELTPSQLRALRVLSRQVMAGIELRHRIRAQQATERSLRDLATRLENQNSRLVEAQAVAKVGSWETNLTTLAVTWSDETHRIFETDPATFQPTHARFLERVHPDDRGVVDQAFVASTAQDGPRACEHRVLLPDGRIKTVEERWQIFRDDHGRPFRAIGTCRDITERKALEERVLRSQRLESLGTLAGGIAHDLNNLLAPIVMGVDLLKLLVTDPAPLRTVNNIERSARRGKELVRQVLSFARGVEGARVAIAARHLIREIEDIVQTTFPKNIVFECDVPRDLWLTSGDPTQLNQVLLNVCVNARDAMPRGGRLRVTARNVVIDRQFATMTRHLTAGRYIRIDLSDTGTGIAPEVMDRLFEPFFTTKELGQGTGLGLSTAIGIIRSHGGVIDVASTVGRGSTFSVYLPAQADDAAPADPVQPETVDLPRGRGQLVLVVDDEATVRDVTRQTLENFGYRVLTAEDGAQAVAVYATHRSEIAAVLTDMMMPVMDGAALIAALRRIDSRLPIVAASGLETEESLARAATGTGHFLAKPYSAEALLESIGQVLAG